MQCNSNKISLQARYVWILTKLFTPKIMKMLNRMMYKNMLMNWISRNTPWRCRNAIYCPNMINRILKENKIEIICQWILSKQIFKDRSQSIWNYKILFWLKIINRINRKQIQILKFQTKMSHFVFNHKQIRKLSKCCKVISCNKFNQLRKTKLFQNNNKISHSPLIISLTINQNWCIKD